LPKRRCRQTFRRQQRQPALIFELAGRELVGAERRWTCSHSTSTKTVRFPADDCPLGAAKKPQEARRIFDRVKASGRSSNRESLDGQVLGQSGQLIPRKSRSLRGAASRRGGVARLSGSSYNTIVGGFGPELLYQRDDTFYLATTMVSPGCTRAGGRRTSRFSGVTSISTPRTLPQYRSGSLWALLDAVLRHRSLIGSEAGADTGEAVLAPIQASSGEALSWQLWDNALLADACALRARRTRRCALKATEDMHTASTRGRVTLGYAQASPCRAG
jgi:hypothetical protein